MKTQELYMGCLALMFCLAGCSVDDYSPETVQAAVPPYQPFTERMHVARLEQKGVTPRKALRNEVCILHDMKMDVITVPEIDGQVKPTAAYVQEMPKYFPNGRFLCPPELFSETKLLVIPVCPKCIAAQRAWLAAEKTGEVKGAIQ